MNKALQSLFCLCAVAAMFGSCQKDDPAPNMTLHATIADHYTPNESNAKVVLNNYTPTFVDEDSVWVNSYKSIVDVNGSGVELSYEEGYGTSSYAAVYPYECVNKTAQGESKTFPVYITLPSEQNYAEDGNGNQIINAPMAAYSETDALSFQNVCALVRVRVRNNVGMGDFHLESITITSTSNNLAGEANIAADFTLNVTGSGKSVTLSNINEDVKENTSSKEYFIYIPPVDDEIFTIEVKGTFLDEYWQASYTQVQTSSASIEKNKIGHVSQLLNQCSSDLHTIDAAAFSVSATKQVYFAPGNLQYQHSTGTWRFAADHYIALLDGGEGGNTLSQSDLSISDKWIGLFGWGTSGWYNQNLYYQPWNRIYNSTSGIGYGYGPTDGSNYIISLTGDYANADWGVYNAIENGGNAPGIWRTLTKDEWNYVIGIGSGSKRLNYDTKRAYASVNGVMGILLLPDTWTIPEGIEITTNVRWTSCSSTNTYSLAQWAKLRNNGAVFLPVTGHITKGYTSTTSTFTVGDKTYLQYWSTTTEAVGTAVKMNSTPTGATSFTAATQSSSKYYKVAVRLVKDL